MKILKNKITTLLTATFITTLILFSCTKNDDNQLEIAKIDAVKAGVLHNKYLDETLNKMNNLSSKSANNQDELKNIILNLDIDGLSYEDKTIILDEISNLSIEDIKNQTIANLNNPLASEYYNQIDNAIDNSNNIEELKNTIDNIIINAENNLTGSDWNVIMAFAETSKASAEYWYPIEMGGSGKGYSVLLSKSNTLGKSSLQLNKKLPGWAKADGRGAGYGMTGWALTGGLGGPVGFLGATLISAVFSSADYAAYN